MSERIVVRRRVFDRQSVFFIALHLALFGGTLAAIATLGRAEPARDARDRELGAKLQAAGLLAPALEAYERYLGEPGLPPAERAKVAFSAGELARELGRHERALQHYYAVEIADPGSPLTREVGPKIVAALERLGRVSAADQALASRTARQPQPESASKVIARIGQEQVTLADLDAALATLPPEAAAQWNDKAKKRAFAERYVAEQLLYRKARKLELDRDPTVQKQLEQLGRQLVVSRLVEREVVAGLKIDPKDLENYFKANQARFGKKTLADARAEVEHAYRAEKIQAGYQRLVDEALRSGDVELHLEAVGGR